MAAGKLIFSARFPYLARQLLVWKVVPTLTSKSAEIYLSMAGAKQLVTRGLSWFQPGPYDQQWCARGTILRCTVVLTEGGYKRGRRRGRASRSQRFFDGGKCQYRGDGRKRVGEYYLSSPRGQGTAPPFIGQGGGSLQAYRTVLATCDGMADSATEWTAVLANLASDGASWHALCPSRSGFEGGGVEISR
jgi:hypothetical protein